MISAAALATILWAQAAAPPSPVELRWEAPAGCPDVATVQGEIARGVPPSDAVAEPIHADVVVSALDAEHWRAALELRGGDWTATRVLNGPTCAAVADAAGLVIGLALTTALQEREIVAAPSPPVVVAPPARPRSTPAVALALVGDVGTLPRATPGAALAFGWRFRRARVDLRASLFASRAGVVAAEPDTGGRLSLASLGARACYLRGGLVSAGPCAEMGVDRLDGAGTGPITVMTGAVTSFAPFVDGGLELEWRLSRWVVPFATVEGAIPLVRARFSVEDIGQVHQPAAVLLRGAAGLEVRFR